MKTEWTEFRKVPEKGIFRIRVGSVPHQKIGLEGQPGELKEGVWQATDSPKTTFRANFKVQLLSFSD
jgi:hypothetical protein